MPGYSVNIRHQLMEESAKVDSLVTSLELQRQYLNVITQVVAGEVSSDTIQSIDSMQLIMREKLLVAKSEVTADFIAQYESSEKDNLQLFETVLSANTSHPSNFFAPIHGAVTTPFSTKDRKYAITISSYGNKNASSTLDGTIISVLYGVNSQYSVIIQHTQFTSIYHGIQQPTKRVGDTVKAGEVIGVIKDNTLGFELWKNGQPINPEEFIVF
jgi:murein DD-endopeptidase MepM/ murein hydrolase activator NlpD